MGRYIPTREEKKAPRQAPVLLQKLHGRYRRADFITWVDFADRWPDIHNNWESVWEIHRDGYRHELKAFGYYSVVETHTHFYLLYAFKHLQDWSAFCNNPVRSAPSVPNQHLHDMEGCLAALPKRENHEQEVAAVEGRRSRTSTATGSWSRVKRFRAGDGTIRTTGTSGGDRLGARSPGGGLLHGHARVQPGVSPQPLARGRPAVASTCEVDHGVGTSDLT